MGLLRSPAAVSMDVDVWDAVPTLSVLESSLYVGIVDVGINLQFLEMRFHSLQSLLFLCFAAIDETRIRIPQSLYSATLCFNLLELLGSVLDQDLTCFLKALIGEGIERDARGLLDG